MMRLSRILQAVAFGAIFVAVAVGPGGPPAGRPLSRARLREVVGTSKQYHIEEMLSCSEVAARAGASGSVAWDGCTAGNAGVSCMKCSAGEHTHMAINQGYRGGPGLRFGQTLSCGTMSAGSCQIINGTPSCGNLTPISVNCTSVTQQYNQ